jgi:GDP-4-dehydro-6-deoxy-D-mannose reductase
MKTLITGSLGFVGRHLQKMFEHSYSLCHESKPLDIRDANQLSVFLARVKPDAVVHLAAQSFVPLSFENPLDTYQINFLGTLNLLNALKTVGFQGRFLYVGSGDVYGAVEEQFLPIKEHQSLKPRNPYAVSKLAAEALCYQWSQTEDFEVILARPFNQIGPGQSDHFALSNFAKQLVEIKCQKRTFLESGDLDVSRDFVDVRDAAHAYKMLIDRGNNGEVYNVCSGREIYLKEALETLIALSGLETKSIPRKESVDRIRKSQQKRIVGSFSKINSLGWEPKISMEKTLEDILKDWEIRINGK